jgi:hypothetical protein
MGPYAELSPDERTAMFDELFADTHDEDAAQADLIDDLVQTCKEILTVQL